MGLRGGGAERCAPSEGLATGSLDLGAVAVKPFVLVLTADSVPSTSGGGVDAGACASRWGAWIESAKLRPGWRGDVIEVVGAGGSGVGAGMWVGVSLEGRAVVCSGVCEESRGCEIEGGPGEVGPIPDDGSGNLGERSFNLSDDDAFATPAPSDPFTRRTGTMFAILGDSEPEPTEGEGLVLSKLWGSCFNESSRIGDMSCNCAFSMFAVLPGSGLVGATELDGTPQSSRSGRLSSSSPAQSIWLPGVEGLWSMAKARTCSTSESMFVFAAEELATVGERCGGVFFGGVFLGSGDDGPERDLRAFTVCTSAVEPSDGFVAPEGLLCARRRRVDILEEVVDAECGPDAAVGDAGSIVNEGRLSAAWRGARLGPSLDSEPSVPSGGWEGEDEEDFLLAFGCGGVDTIEGTDFGSGFAVVFMLLSAVGEEPWLLPPRVVAPPRRPLPPRPRSLRLALALPRPLFGLRGVDLRSPVCPQSSREEVGPGGGGMEREAMRDRVRWVLANVWP